MSKQKKINFISLIFIIIIIIVIAVIITVLGIEKIKRTKNSKADTQQKNEIVSSDLVEDKYKSFLGNIKNSMAKLDNADTNSVNEKSKPFIFEKAFITNMQIELNLDYTGDLYLITPTSSSIAKRYGKEYKIKSNIVKSGICEIGKNKDYVIWFIGDKGDFEYIKIETKNITSKNIELEIKKIEDMKNIIDVKNLNISNTLELIGIDIEGKIVKIIL